jgi:hypothetical protein
MSHERMAEVYSLAQKWDLVIIEDDAYYWLQYADGPDSVPGLNLRRGSPGSTVLAVQLWKCSHGDVAMDIIGSFHQGFCCVAGGWLEFNSHHCTHCHRLAVVGR